MSETIEVVSTVAGRHLILAPTPEEHDREGRRIVTGRGQKLKFVGTRARLPEEWLETFQSHPEYGKSLYLASDEGAPGPRGVPVVNGQMTASDRPAPGVQPPSPLENWDTAHVSEIKRVIETGQMDAQIAHAIAYEVSHRNRSQVVMSLSRRQRDLANEGDESEED